MTLWNSFMKRGVQDNPTQLSIRNDKENYSNRINQIVNTSKSIPPLLDMKEQLRKVRESKTTLPLSMVNGTTSRLNK